MRQWERLVLPLAMIAAAAPPARSQEPQTGAPQEGTYETVSAAATSSGDTGLFDVYSAYTLIKHKISVGGFRHNVDRDPNNLDISNFIGTVALGLTDRLELFGRFDVARRIDADDLGQPGFYNDQPRTFLPWSDGFGDVTAGAKLNLLSEYRDQPVGLAVRGFVKFPTAGEDEGLGTTKASGGAHVVVSKNLGSQVESSYYAGFRGNGSPEEVQVGHALEWGLGLGFPESPRSGRWSS